MRILKYILAAACVSVGILLWVLGTTISNPLLWTLGTVLVCVHSLILLDRAELREPIRFTKPKWKPKKFFTGISIILCFAIFIVVFMHIPQEQAADLFAKWYFSGTFWLLFMTNLAMRFVDENEKT